MNKRNLEDYEKKYNDKDHYDFERLQVEYRRKNTLTHLNKNAHSSILEVGSGIDPLFCYVDSYDEFTVVEPSAKFYEIAKKFKGDDNRISLYHDYIEKVNLDKKYDLIIISSLLHEIDNAQSILSAINKFCHSNTVVYINVPNAKSFHRLLALEAGIINNIYNKSDNQIKFQQTHTYDIDTLGELLEKSGFSIIESGSYFIKPFTHTQMRKLLDHNIITKDVLNGLDKMVKYCPELGSEIFMTCRLNY